MTFLSQVDTLERLQQLADSRQHSVLVAGTAGCGKTFIASKYGNMLNIEDMVNVPAQVSEIRNTIDECYQIENDVLVCIENLDTGVAGASYTMLKFLEEPQEHVYIVITCRNLNRIPDTIISRSTVVYMSPPLPADINTYAEKKDSTKYLLLSKNPIWKCIKSFQDVDIVFNLTVQQVDYFATLTDTMKCKNNISALSWKLGHFDDNTETPLNLVIGYIIANSTDAHIRESGMKCMADLNGSRIAKHAVLARFLFECKYCE